MLSNNMKCENCEFYNSQYKTGVKKEEEKVVVDYGLIGRILSKPIYRGNTLLLVDGVVLTRGLISLLYKNNINEAYVKKIDN